MVHVFRQFPGFGEGVALGRLRRIVDRHFGKRDQQIGIVVDGFSLFFEEFLEFRFFHDDGFDYRGFSVFGLA